MRGNASSWSGTLDSLEYSLPATPVGIHQVFSRIPRSRIALETGTHSPWVSRQLTQLGHEMIVARARNVQLIGENSRKDDPLTADIKIVSTPAKNPENHGSVFCDKSRHVCAERYVTKDTQMGESVS